MDTFKVARFVDNKDGAVIDTKTGLIWQKDTAPDTYEWQDALSYCKSFTLAGHNDWRLPNINELQSLVDYTRCSPSINTSLFPNTVSSYYWSSTTYAGRPNYAWYVNFLGGLVSYSYKSRNGYVRAVRGGH